MIYGYKFIFSFSFIMGCHILSCLHLIICCLHINGYKYDTCIDPRSRELSCLGAKRLSALKSGDGKKKKKLQKSLYMRMHYRLAHVVKMKIFCCVESICVNWFFIRPHNLYIHNCIEHTINLVSKSGEIINKTLLSFSVKSRPSGNTYWHIYFIIG